MLKKLSHLSRISLMLGLFFALDKIFAFARAIIIARQFSLSTELDVFNVANNLPDLLFALISGGALAMAFIPVLTEVITRKSQADAWELFSRVANLAFLVTGAMAIFVAIFAKEIVRSQFGIAPGFGSEQQNLVSELMRLNLIATLIFSISGLVMAGLQANQHFLLPALAPILYNVGQIFGALVFSPSEPYSFGSITLPAFGLGVHGLVYGVIIGAAMHLGIQIPGLIKYKFRWAPTIKIKDPAMLAVFKVVGPRLLTMFFIQLMFIARDNFASRLEQVGAVTSLTYGWMIMQVPETLLGTAIATALLPTLAQFASQGQWENFRATIEKASQVLLALSLPVAALIAVGIRPLVSFAFGFDQAGTDLLSWTARVYMLTLAGYALQEIMARAFYARQEAWIPFWSVLIRIGIYISVALVAIFRFSHVGAPLIAFAEFALTFEAFIMLGWLNKRLAIPVKFGKSLLRGALAALTAGLVALGLMSLFPLASLPTTLMFLMVAGGVATPVIWPEIRTLLRL